MMEFNPDVINPSNILNTGNSENFIPMQPGFTDQSTNYIPESNTSFLPQTTFNHFPCQNFVSSPNFSPQAGCSTSWAHTVPDIMPWITSMGPNFVFKGTDPAMHMHKRKDTLDPDDGPLCKRHISDEMMAAHLRKLNINQDFGIHENFDVQAMQESSIADEILMDCAPRIILSDEIRSLKQERILPKQICDKIIESNMAIVLWKPPSPNISAINALNAAEKETRSSVLMSDNSEPKEENEETDEVMGEVVEDNMANNNEEGMANLNLRMRRFTPSLD